MPLFGADLWRYQGVEHHGFAVQLDPAGRDFHVADAVLLTWRFPIASSRWCFVPEKKRQRDLGKTNQFNVGREKVRRQERMWREHVMPVSHLVTVCCVLNYFIFPSSCHFCNFCGETLGETNSCDGIAWETSNLILVMAWQSVIASYNLFFLVIFWAAYNSYTMGGM